MVDTYGFNPSLDEPASKECADTRVRGLSSLKAAGKRPQTRGLAGNERLAKARCLSYTPLHGAERQRRGKDFQSPREKPSGGMHVAIISPGQSAVPPFDRNSEGCSS